MVELTYPPWEDIIQAKDFSGISHSIFNPPAGTLVEVLKEFVVSVTVYDYSGNSGTCSFTYKAESELLSKLYYIDDEDFVFNVFVI